MNLTRRLYQEIYRSTVVLPLPCRRLGVALGWRELVEQFLLDGSLVRPMSEELTSEIGYYRALRMDKELKESARLFLSWLQEPTKSLKLGKSAFRSTGNRFAGRAFL